MFEKKSKTRKCKVCKIEFPKEGTQKICSEECKVENRKRQKEERFENRYGHIKTATLFIKKQRCPDCGKLDWLKMDGKFIRCNMCASPLPKL